MEKIHGWSGGRGRSGWCARQRGNGPSATRMGSMSPIRSATDVSGVASFSANLRPGGARQSGSLAPLGENPTTLHRDRPQRRVVELGPGYHRDLGVEQLDQTSDETCLRLTSLPEEDDVVPGEDCPLQRRDDRVTEPDDPWEQIGTGAEALHEVVAKLFLDSAICPSGILEFAERAWLLDRRRIHRVTVGVGRR